MPTLLRYNHPILGIAKCDAGCYNAEKPDCDCICKGKNHGVGFKQAKLNTLLEGHQMIKDWERTLEDHLKTLL